PDRPARPTVQRPTREVDPAPAPNRDAAPPTGNVERLRVPIGDSPTIGGDEPLVTIVEFSDFHCPYCGRGTDTVHQLLETYGDDIRVVFKNNPLPMHPNAPLAARAALAAGEQGHFWEIHDFIFANRTNHSRENQADQFRDDLAAYAAELGMDVDAFRAAMDDSRLDTLVAADQRLANTVAARGTPHFFINGRRLRGAQPVAAFQEIIDSEIALANQMIEQGVARGDLYDNLMEDALAEAPAEAPAAAPAPSRVDPPAIGDSATKGPEDAPVTIFVFSEFQCPYCGRAQGTISQIEERYGDQIRWVFKSFPLPFHSDANLASQAALAAGAQGKFWEYHDILFQNQRALSRANLESYAQQLELDMDQFRADLDSGRFAEQIDQETAEGRAVGVSGTPTFVVNGERIVGAQPFSAFQPVIDRALEN
ncbi:MAG: thioredoxin domain-containing protein, partial [Myxococcales bacterium]|nr:thioredoxin domain-containing protein [Myxococcales bacterium]